MADSLTQMINEMKPYIDSLPPDEKEFILEIEAAIKVYNKAFLAKTIIPIKQ